MEYFGRKPFVMNILQTVTSRKHLKGRSLRAGNGGVPPPRTESEGEERTLLHKAKKIGAPKSIHHAQQSLMLDLSLRKLGGHRSGVGRDQIALRHLQLALLRLRIGARRLQ